MARGSRAQLERNAADAARGDLTETEWQIMRPILLERIAAAEAKGVVRSELPDVDDIAASFDGLTIDAQRAVLARLVDSVVLAPSANRGRFDKTRFTINATD